MKPSHKRKRHGLTPRQQKFANAYLKTLNKSEAARQAGYKGEYAHIAGGRYAQIPAIKAYIDKHLSILLNGEKNMLSREVIEELRKEAFEGQSTFTVKDSEGNELYRHNPAKMKALELLAKYGGLLIEKHEHTGKDGGPVVIKWPDDPNPTP